MAKTTFDSSDSNFQKLLKSVMKDSSSVVPFIGAGMSAYGIDGGRLPTWPELLKGLLEYALLHDCLDSEQGNLITKDIENGDLIPSTGKLLKLMGPPHFMRYIRGRLDASDSILSPGMLNLVSIAWSIIVTTNLDNVIELSFDRIHGRTVPVITNRQEAELSETIARGPYQDSVVLAKIHGSIDDYSSWVLAPEHYNRLMTNDAYIETLRQLFTRQLFFIGYGLRDDDFDIVQDYLSHIYPEGLGEFYALIPDFLRGSSGIRNLIRTRCLVPIYYPVIENHLPDDPWRGHGAVGECLAILASEWAKGVDSLPVILKAFYDLESDIWVRKEESDTLSKYLLEAHASVQVIGYGGEGKTTFVQHWIESNRSVISRAGFDMVYGFSFYLASPDRFIEQAYLSLCKDDMGSKDLSSRLSALCDKLSKVKVLLFLDGIEVILDIHGQVKNPYVRNLINSVEQTKSSVVITTRTPVVGNYAQIPLKPLTKNDSKEFALRLGLKNMHPAQLESFLKRAGGHALSIRFGSSLAHTKDETDDLSELAIVEEETSLLYANKTRKTLRYYESVLSKEQLAFMRCFSVFRSPTSFQTVELALQNEYRGWDENTSLLSIDIRAIILGLKEMRLIILTQGSYLTMHPNVKDFFTSKNVRMNPLHTGIARTLIEQLPDKDPDTFEECEPFLDACYHAAKASLWSEFHYIFVMRINREFRNHLGNSIGAWNEYRETALLAFPDQDPNREPVIQPELYSQINARCLKHLGESDEAKTAYPKSLMYCARIVEPETTKYINNYLTLITATGDLDLAARVASWNFATLSWINEEWRRAWQVEHGAFSIAWLAFIRGDLPTCSKLFSTGETAWENIDANRVEVFDYFPVYFVEALLCQKKPRISRARSLAENYLSAGYRNSWPETQVRAHIALSQIGRFSESRKFKSGGFEESNMHLVKAEKICSRVLLPPTELELTIERVRLSLDIIEVGRGTSDLDSLKELISRIELLISQLGLNLYLPELNGLKGRLAIQFKNDGNALRLYNDGMELAYQQNNVASRLSEAQSLFALRTLLAGIIPTHKEEFASFAWKSSYLSRVKYKKPSSKSLMDAIESQFFKQPQIY